MHEGTETFHRGGKDLLMAEGGKDAPGKRRTSERKGEGCCAILGLRVGAQIRRREVILRWEKFFLQGNGSGGIGGKTT